MRRISLALLLVLAPAALRAQVVRGSVVDAATGAPVARAAVRLLAADSALAVAVTDTAGRFVIRAPRAGAFRVSATRLGYAETRSGELLLSPGDVLDVVYQLPQQTVTLDPLQVVTQRRLPWRLVQFEERAARAGPGVVIVRRDELLRRSPSRATDALNGIGGLRIRRHYVSSIGTQPQLQARSGCIPAVFIDGVHVDAGSLLDDQLTVNDIEGVEIYRTASDAPAEYRTRSICAVVLVWTRTGT